MVGAPWLKPSSGGRASWRIGTTAVVAFVLVFAALPRAVPQQSDSQPLFRSESSLVSVNVSVRRGNRPVTGLTAADFLITDNGVPQKAERVDFEAVPIDLTLVVDLSGSTSQIVDDIRRDARRILGLLRPIDRARVLAIHTSIHELLPLQTITGEVKLGGERAGTVGQSSVRDAITAALVNRADPDRRSLVVAITDGEDNKSIVEAKTMLEVARRSDTVLHLVLVATPGVSMTPLGGGGGWSQAPNRPFDRPPMTKEEWNTMLEAAVVTGGAFHGGSFDSIKGSSRNAVDTFRAVFEDFRQSYVVRYQPEGVAPAGWHEIGVTVKGVESGGVRARNGYFGGRGRR